MSIRDTWAIYAAQFTTNFSAPNSLVWLDATIRNFKFQFGLKFSIACKQQDGRYTVWEYFRFNNECNPVE